jgi:hypothetical protein
LELESFWEQYRAFGLALLPCRPNSKAPSVKGFHHWEHPPGKDAVASWAAAQPSLNPALLVGFNDLVVIDIDDRDLTAKVRQLLPETPIQVATPSGGHHLYYRCLEPMRAQNLRRYGIPIDIKAGPGSYALVPPASIDGHKYQFLFAGFESIGDVPALSTTHVTQLIETLGSPRDLANAARPNRGYRNNWLFRKCLFDARHCETLEELLDCAETANDDVPDPLRRPEVEQIARSAWKYQQEERNWSGQEAVAQIPESIRAKICCGQAGSDALALYVLLRTKHSARNDEFCIAIDAMIKAELLPCVTKMRLRRARDHLCTVGVIERVHIGGRGKGDPARFRFRV